MLTGVRRCNGRRRGDWRQPAKDLFRAPTGGSERRDGSAANDKPRSSHRTLAMPLPVSDCASLPLCLPAERGGARSLPHPPLHDPSPLMFAHRAQLSASGKSNQASIAGTTANNG